MLNRFSKTDQGILLMAVLGLIVSSYLLYDNSLLSQWTGEKQAEVGELLNTSQDVRRKHSSQVEWRTLSKRTKLHQGDSLFTGSQSQAEVLLNDGSHFTLGENSLIVLNQLGEETNLVLRFGRLKGRINQQIVIQSDTQNLCAKGAELELSTNSDGVPVLSQQSLSQFSKCPEKTPKAVRIVSARKVQAKPKAAPRPKKIFITHPKNNFNFEIPTNTQGLPTVETEIEVKWTGSEKETYEIALSETKNFETKIVEDSVVSNQWKSPKLSKGRFYVRVRQLGEKSWSTPVSFNLKFIEPTPPPVLAKVPEQKVEAPQPAPKPRVAPLAKLITPQPEKLEVVHKASSERPLNIAWSQKSSSKLPVKVEWSLDKSFKESKHVLVNGNSWKTKDFPASQFYVRLRQQDGKRLSPPSQSVFVKIIADRPRLNPSPEKSIAAKSPKDKGEPTDFSVSWSSLPLVSQYKVQWSNSKDFRRIKELVSPKPRATIRVPSAGKFYWRVQALDQNRRPLSEYSETGQLSYRLDRNLGTPKLLEPSHKIVLYFPRPKDVAFWLEWRPAENAETYAIEVAKDKSFKNAVLSKTTKEPRFLLKKTLAEGELYWRVKTLANKDSSAWSEIRSVKIVSGRRAAK